MNRIFKLLSRGSSGGNRARPRRGGRPRGEGSGLVGTARKLLRRR